MTIPAVHSPETEAPRTEAVLLVLDRVAPELRPTRCPLPDSRGEHETHGGLCHCGWSRQRPQEAGHARTPDAVEWQRLIADVYDAGRAAATMTVDGYRDLLAQALQYADWTHSPLLRDEITKALRMES